MRSDIITEPVPDRFSVCYDHSCHIVVHESISDTEWAAVTAPLRSPAEDAQAEREAIAEAIAIMETIIGKQTGTSVDKGGNLKGFGRQFQMDCIDESTNTHTYLRMLEQDGHLKKHRLTDRSTRFGLFIGMPHTTAVIVDISDKTRYAVDSWFYDNGQLPAIIELSDWKSGWRPARN